MAVSVVPALIDALVTQARSVVPSTTSVYDGFGIGEQPGDFLMVGVDDAESERTTDSATSRQDWANANGTAREEEGEITCVALSWVGAQSNEQKLARDAAYATVEALATACRTNPSLGVTSVLWTSFGTSVDLSQWSNDSGSVALVKFQIQFRARI